MQIKWKWIRADAWQTSRLQDSSVCSSVWGIFAKTY